MISVNDHRSEIQSWFSRMQKIPVRWESYQNVRLDSGFRATFGAHRQLFEFFNVVPLASWFFSPSLQMRPKFTFETTARDRWVSPSNSRLLYSSPMHLRFLFHCPRLYITSGQQSIFPDRPINYWRCRALWWGKAVTISMSILIRSNHHLTRCREDARRPALYHFDLLTRGHFCWHTCIISDFRGIYVGCIY